MRGISVVVAVLATVVLAACGGNDNPKVSESGYLDKCSSELHDRAKDAPTKISDAQIDDICKCTQSKLVAAGFGDKHVNDDTALAGSKVADIGRECTVQSLTGG